LQIYGTVLVGDLHYVDIITGNMKVFVVFNLYWSDERCAWDASKYGGIDELQVNADDIWQPTMNFGINTDDKSGSVLQSVKVQSDGTVSFAIGTSMEAQCEIDVSLYPFDTHECSLSIFTSRYSSEHVVFQALSDTPDFFYDFPGNGEWEIPYSELTAFSTTSFMSNGESISIFNTMLWVKRRPYFMLMNYFAPALILTMLTSLTSFIPPDSGERLSYVITVYLATVFLGASITDDIPNVSVKMPLVSYLTIVNNVLYALAVAWSVFVVRMARLGDEVTIPNICLRITRKRNVNTVDVEQVKDGETGATEENMAKTKGCHRTKWIDVASYFDGIFRVVFSSVLVLTQIVFLSIFRERVAAFVYKV